MDFVWFANYDRASIRWLQKKKPDGRILKKGVRNSKNKFQNQKNFKSEFKFEIDN
jgi:hypothetical protein